MEIKFIILPLTTCPFAPAESKALIQKRMALAFQISFNFQFKEACDGIYRQPTVRPYDTLDTV